VEIDELARDMAAHLDASADAIVERWVTWLEDDVATRTIKGLPRRAIRNHIPPVLRSIAAFVETPVNAARHAMMGNLELHATLRRSQGYALHELLQEFDGLAHIVDEELRDALERSGSDPSPATVVEVFSRLGTGMRAIGFVTVAVYRERESQQERQLSEKLEEFARTIAHELRSPLQTAGLGLDALREDLSPDDAVAMQRHLEIVHAALGRARGLIDNLGQLALVEAGRSRGAHFGRVRRLVEETLEHVGPVARDKGVELRLDSDVPDVAVDRLAFQLTLSNVLYNAIKYSDPEEAPRYATLTFAVQPVEHDLDQLTAVVEDNGLGIPAEYVHQVMKRHIRAHPEIVEGTGLGLAISRQLLLERGGEIGLESEHGDGTRVTFHLPCHPGDVLDASTAPGRFAIVERMVADGSGAEDA